MAAAGAALFLLAGPLLWLGTIRAAQKWTPEDRRAAISFICAGYKDTFSFWEITVLIRRQLLAIGVILMPPSYSPFGLIAFNGVVMSASLLVHMACLPYADSVLNYVEGAVLTSCIISLWIVCYISGTSWTLDDEGCVMALMCLVMLLAATAAVLTSLLVIHSSEKVAASLKRVVAVTKRFASICRDWLQEAPQDGAPMEEASAEAANTDPAAPPAQPAESAKKPARAKARKSTSSEASES
eukprot:TRINITY_DN2335_c2_g1_i1.p1 TRINITY_DN2335_c2_g1~~TRINITY_DN2335_c2_g1_i1.p1  ORF type:complete len:261 (-),score=41.98 TRINITY_DN2335_c2_g1_i1:21-743(-)